MPAPHYNPVLGILWLVKEWPQIEQYLQIGEMKEMVTDETAMNLSKEELETIEEMAKLQEEPESSEADSDVFITKQKTLTPKEKKLKRDLAKKNKEVQQKLGTEKGSKSKKEVQFGDLPGNKPKKGNKKPVKGRSKGKEAEKDQSTSDRDDPGDDFSSSSNSSIGSGDSGEESENNTRNIRQLSPSQIEWEKTTGKQSTAKTMSKKMLKNSSLVKLPPPDFFNSTDKKWRNLTVFDQYTARMEEWLTYQGLDIQKEEAVSRFSWICKDSALSWYEEYCTRVKPKERNYHAFILELRKKVVPSIAGLELWKEWKEYRHDKLTTKHGPNPPVNQHSLEYLKYYNSCIDLKEEKMINMHALKVKFVTTLLEHIRRPTKILIDYNMDYKKIVETAERMQADNSKNNPARAITDRGTIFYYDSLGRKVRQKTPEERGRSPGFQRST